MFIDRVLDAADIHSPRFHANKKFRQRKSRTELRSTLFRMRVLPTAALQFVRLRRILRNLIGRFSSDSWRCKDCNRVTIAFRKRFDRSNAIAFTPSLRREKENAKQ